MAQIVKTQQLRASAIDLPWSTNELIGSPNREPHKQEKKQVFRFEKLTVTDFQNVE